MKKFLNIQTLIFIAGISLALIAAYIFVQKVLLPANTSKAQGVAAGGARAGEAKKAAAKPKDAKKGKKVQQKMIGPTFALNPIIVNVAGSNARRFLKATIVLEMSDEKLTEELNKRSPQIYDLLNSILSSYKMEEIGDASGREALRNEMKDRINLFLMTGKVENVYFNELVIQ